MDPIAVLQDDTLDWSFLTVGEESMIVAIFMLGLRWILRVAQDDRAGMTFGWSGI